MHLQRDNWAATLSNTDNIVHCSDLVRATIQTSDRGILVTDEALIASSISTKINNTLDMRRNAAPFCDQEERQFRQRGMKNFDNTVSNRSKTIQIISAM